jgi:hypothetical protein
MIGDAVHFHVEIAPIEEEICKLLRCTEYAAEEVLLIDKIEEFFSIWGLLNKFFLSFTNLVTEQYFHDLVTDLVFD